MSPHLTFVLARSWLTLLSRSHGSAQHASIHTAVRRGSRRGRQGRHGPQRDRECRDCGVDRHCHMNEPPGSAPDPFTRGERGEGACKAQCLCRSHMAPSEAGAGRVSALRCGSRQSRVHKTKTKTTRDRGGCGGCAVSCKCGAGAGARAGAGAGARLY